MEKDRKKSSYSSQLTGVEVEVIKIGGRHLQGFMNGCFPKDSERCVVEVQSCYYLGQNLSNVTLVVSMIASWLNIPLKCALGNKFCSTQYSQDNNISV
jgi:hypothetical protein